MAVASRPFSALQHRNFRLYLFGQVISMSGTWMQRTAQSWLIYQVTGSELWLGILAFALGIPVLLISPFAGVLADRLSRRNILRLSYGLEMLIAMGLGVATLMDKITAESLISAALVLGFISAVSEPVRQAFMRDLVGLDDLNSGIALNALIFNIGAMIGPAIAGVSLVFLGAEWCFLLNGATYFAVLVSLNLIEYSQAPNLNKKMFFAQIGEGLDFVKNHSNIRRMLLLQFLLNTFSINMLITLLPAFASQALNSPTVGYSSLSTALGVGSLVGGALNVWIGTLVGRGKLVTTLAVILPCCVILLSITPVLTVAFFLTMVLGLGYTLFFVTENILIQTQTPDHYVGRVMSLWTMTRFGISPVVALGLSFLAEQVGVLVSYIAISVIVVVVCGFIVMPARELRRLK